VEKHRNQTARLGSNASLRCEAKGDHPLKIVWKKAGSQLDPKLPDYRYTLKEDNTTDGAVSILGFISTSREDSGRYFCIASNAYGRDEMTIHLYIQGKTVDGISWSVRDKTDVIKIKRVNADAEGFSSFSLVSSRTYTFAGLTASMFFHSYRFHTLRKHLQAN